MDWFPWYFTIYEKDTMHLNPYQDGCYRRLIDHYMRTRSPLPDNDAALARIIGDSLENWSKNASRIVRAFFTHKNGMLFHRFCDKILDEQEDLSKSRSKSAKIAAEKRWKNKNTKDNKNNELDATPMRDVCETYATPMREDATRQDNTLQYKKEKIIKKEKVGEAKKPDEVSEALWEDFRQLRKVKKAPVTKTALNGIQNQARLAGISLAEALEICCRNGWAGFKADWIINQQKGTKNGKSKLKAEADELLEQIRAGKFVEGFDGID